MEKKINPSKLINNINPPKYKEVIKELQYMDSREQLFNYIKPQSSFTDNTKTNPPKSKPMVDITPLPVNNDKPSKPSPMVKMVDYGSNPPKA